MKYVLSAQQMKDIDARTINELGIPSRVLMENAGKSCAELIIDTFKNHLTGTTAIFCGSGNNGGDGAVIARWLHEFGVPVIVICLYNKTPTPDNKANLEICDKLEIPIFKVESESDFDDILDEYSDVTFMVDAIFGAGYKGALSRKMRQFIEFIQKDLTPIVAIDLPSGIDADTGMGAGAINAEATLALGAYKYGHLVGEGAKLCGDLYLVDIGIPDIYYRRLNCGRLLEVEDLHFPYRTRFSDKSNYGSVAVFAGSPGLTGAAVLACQAALHTGAGLITLYHQSALAQIFEIKLTEVMTRVIPEDEAGLPDAGALHHLLQRHNAILIGPGISQSNYALKLLETVLSYDNKGALERRPYVQHRNAMLQQGALERRPYDTADEPPSLVIDADGLRLLAKHRHLLDLLADRNIVLTPHIREFAALTGLDVETLNQDIVTHVTDFVHQYRCKVLLKGAVTIYYDGTDLMFNNNGNNGLATGGSGDVLAGIIVSYMAQDPTMSIPAIHASQFMGLTADRLINRILPYGLTPSDIIENLFVFSEGGKDA
ncbi:MAG: NAD(P)H-hydrate epimerase [Candidatus Cloacimonetes bacterium]|nr:NAD(P)H-hydrate epimerase [Candidatus Cloacimonadota bacterium]